MANKFSQKTTVSLYKFDSEDNYRQWLVANSSSIDEFHDIIAIVKNADMNNGLDLFINGHSLTKTRIYIKKSDSIVELKDSNQNVIDDSKQYIIKNFTRKGQGQKNILLLEEYDIPSLIESKIAENIDDFARDGLKGYVEKYIQEYLEVNPVGQTDKKINQIENILTNSHYMFRKLFSLLYRERAGHLGIEMQYLDESRTVLSPSDTEFPVGKKIAYFKFKITGGTGLDVSLKSFRLYKNDQVIMTIKTGLTTGWSQEYSLSNEILTTETIYKGELNYTITSIVNAEDVNNIQNFDEIATFKEKDETITATSTFSVYSGHSDSSTKHIGYLYFIPTDYDADGYTKFKAPYDTTDSLETINWLDTNISTHSDIKRIEFQYTHSSSGSFSYNYSIPTADANYQTYVMIPSGDAKSITSAPIGGFEDTISEICDTTTYNNKEYTLYKQDVAQESGITFVLKLKF